MPCWRKFICLAAGRPLSCAAFSIARECLAKIRPRRGVYFLRKIEKLQIAELGRWRVKTCGGRAGGGSAVEAQPNSQNTAQDASEVWPTQPKTDNLDETTQKLSKRLDDMDWRLAGLETKPPKQRALAGCAGVLLS